MKWFLFELLVEEVVCIISVGGNYVIVLFIVKGNICVYIYDEEGNILNCFSFDFFLYLVWVIVFYLLIEYIFIFLIFFIFCNVNIEICKKNGMFVYIVYFKIEKIYFVLGIVVIMEGCIVVFCIIKGS